MQVRPGTGPQARLDMRKGNVLDRCYLAAAPQLHVWQQLHAFHSSSMSLLQFDVDEGRVALTLCLHPVEESS